MATIHRHRFQLILSLAVVFLMAGALWHTQRQNQPRQVRAAAAQQQQETLDAATYTAVQSLRDDLALTDRDLAAMGLDEQAASTLLLALLQWHEQNTWQIQNAEQAQQAARRELAAAMRKINIGPRNESLIMSVPSLRNAVTSADDQYALLIESAGQAVSNLLNSEQAAIWSTARNNRDHPIRYRYAPNLSSEQAGALVDVMRLARRSDRSFAQAEQSKLTSTQTNAMLAATARIEQHMAGVVAARDAVLPAPVELGMDEQSIEE